jgi:hypothetical protein
MGPDALSFDENRPPREQNIKTVPATYGPAKNDSRNAKH